MSTAKAQTKIRVELSCPKCGGDISRISKRSIDKLINVIVPVKRFTCYHCLWEGNRFTPSN